MKRSFWTASLPLCSCLLLVGCDSGEPVEQQAAQLEPEPPTATERPAGGLLEEHRRLVEETGDRVESLLKRGADRQSVTDDH